MRIKTQLVTIILGLIIFSSCKHSAVSLDFTNAKGEVPLLGNLIFRFNQSLIKDSLINQWDSTDYISFEPKIPGRYRWETPDKLIFSPSQSLAPATNYKAKFKSSVLRFSKYNSIKGGEDISFHTPDLTLDNSQVIWMLEDEKERKAVPQVDLLFNYRINPADLKDKLSVKVNGDDASVSLITLSTDNKISFRITGLRQEDKDYDAKITFAKGLKPESGSNLTAEPIVANLSIPSPYVLTIQNIQSDHDGMDGTVRVTTSQQLTDESLKSFLKFSPDLKYSVQLEDNGFSISSDKFDVEKSYELTILKGLRGKIGGVLKEDYNGSIAFGELEANIRFTNSKAVYLSKKGGKNLEVQITNVPKVKILISKIYENNLLMTERYGYYPKETSDSRYSSYEDNYDEDYYANYGTDVQMGDVIYSKEIDTRSLPKSGGGRILNLGEFEDRLPDFKGIYHISIRSTKDYWVRDSRFFYLY
jgi:uncharacterized protein YfaS (alpha-2-macroglobulin family)